MGKKFTILAITIAVVAFAQPANAQQVRKIGFLSTFSQSHAGSQNWHKAFERGLRDHGWVVGKNITMEHRWIRDRRECRV